MNLQNTMIHGFKIKTIDDAHIKNKQVLIRVDYNVPLDKNHHVTNDLRITETFKTLKHLLNNGNRIILLTHIGRPQGRDPKYSVKPVAHHFQTYFPKYKVIVIDDFEKDLERIKKQTNEEIIFLENIRFYQREKTKNDDFAEKLAHLADIYVNDAFAASHRVQTSVVGVPRHAPSYAGLHMQREVEMISRATSHPKEPVASIIGGVKVSTKIALIEKLLEISNFLLIGGGLANTFMAAQGFKIGKSIYEYEEVEKARQLLYLGGSRGVTQILPQDAVVGHPTNDRVKPEVVDIEEVEDDMYILDIGPKTRKAFEEAISAAKTIIWNGPMGMFENPHYSKGSDHVYEAIVKNKEATSVIGGGDTLAVLNGKKNTDQITHISTGGGAMLEFIEKGTLPGLEALRHSQKKFKL